MKKRWYLIILFSYIFFNSGYGQTVFYDQLDAKNDLPSQVIYDLYKEKNSFLWMATEEGLVQFDGIHFKLFHHPEMSSKAGSNIKKDAYGRIWFQTFDGFLFYVDQNQKLQTFEQKNNLGFVNFLIAKDLLIKTTIEGLEVRNLNQLNQVTHIKIPNFETTFLEIYQEDILFGKEKTYQYNLSTKKLKEIKNSPLKKYFTIHTTTYQNKLYFICQTKTGITDFYQYQNQSFQFIQSVKNLSAIQNIECINQNFWICTKKGIYRTNLKGEELSFKAKLPSENISSIVQDENGTYWLGSLTSGVFIIKDFNMIEYGIENEKLYAISKNKQHLFFSTSSGKIYQTEQNFQSKVIWNKSDYHPIYYLRADLDENYLFFTANGFYAWNLSTNQIDHINGAVKSIAKWNDHKFVATGTGFVNTFQTNPFQWNEQSWLDKIRGKSVAIDAKKDWYLATNNGFIQKKENDFHPILNHHKPFAVKQVESINNQIIGLHVQGNMFTINQGKIEYLTENRSFHGLKKINDTLYAFEKNKIYQITNQEIKKVASIGKYLKIKDLEKKDDYFFVLTDHKIVRLNTKNDVPSKPSKTIQITSTLVNGQTVNLDQKKIGPNENDIQINFQFFDFDNDNDYQLAYVINQKIKPVAYDLQQIKLFSLTEGNYQIKIVLMDKNSDQIVAESSNIHFEILAPYWKRGSFIFLMFALFSLVGWSLFKWKKKQWFKEKSLEIEKLTLENNLKESRLQLIKSQMNPHFFFNAINNIQSYIFTNETKEASNYLSKFSKLTRKILEFSEVTTISLKEEIEALQLYLELQQMRFKDLKFSIKVDSSLNLEQIKIPTMLIQPYVENAILHGLSHSIKEKNLEIDFTLSNLKQLVCNIKDNGIGRIKSAEINHLNQNKPKSFATKANLERIMWLNKNQYQIDISYHDLMDANEESLGTQVTLTINL